MKWVIPVLAGMMAVFIIYGFWSFLFEDSGTRGTTPDQQQTSTMDDSVDGGADSAMGESKAKDDLPPWLDSGLIRVPDTRNRRWDGLPAIIGDLEFLTLGRDKHVVNTIELKMKLDELRKAMLTMSLEEQKLLADYFRACEDSTLKYYLMASFRSWGGEPYVEAIAEYYEAEPNMVGESLQHMMGRTRKAVVAMEQLIDNEIDPLRRAKLIARATYLGAPGSEEMMTRFFNKKNSVDRRQAIPGLARSSSKAAHTLLQELLDGEFERARYLPEEQGASTPEFEDLRCHAVLALLQNGSTTEVEGLLDRALSASDGEDQVAGYITKFFPVVENPMWIPRIVDRMVESGAPARPLLMYLGRRAEQKDIPQLERLAAMELNAQDRELVQDALNRLR